MSIPESPVDQLARTLRTEWPTIRSSRERALAQKRRLEELLRGLVPQDTSVVVFGSLARDEVTSGSDIDWALLVDGQANPLHREIAHEIDERVRQIAKEPGREGTFGGLAISHDLIHRIGGGEDTNRNTTQRILLLLESAAIGPDEAHRRVVSGVLKRYITEDYGWLHRSGPFNVPRFLQNDIARYWRTVAVDFAYKRRERREKGWALRTVKLRMSRKLTYASGLLACFSCAIDPEIAANDDTGPAHERNHHPVVSHLSSFVRQTPLQVVAGMLLPHGQLHESARRLFTSYDAFLSMIDDSSKRKALDSLLPADAAQDPLYQEAREIGHDFQGALNEIFLEENGTRLYELTRTYGVF